MNVVHLFIFGNVHGVGFRKFVRVNAQKLGLVGWVRNLPEGTVEAEVAGSDVSIQKLIKLCKKGPFLAEVTSVDVASEEKDFPYTEFVLRHDVE